MLGPVGWPGTSLATVEKRAQRASDSKRGGGTTATNHQIRLQMMTRERDTVPLLRVRSHIIGNARIKTVGKYLSCVVSK